MTRKLSAHDIVANDKGFVLVVALLFLFILSIIGIMATNTSVMEIQIAGNDKVHKQTFSQADGGTEAGGMLLEENIACPTGFSGAEPLSIGGLVVTTKNFWIIETEPVLPYPSDTLRHIRIPGNDAVPHTNLYFWGDSSLLTGHGLQMNAGNEGIGFGTAAGGGQLVTHIDSQHRGENNSASTVRLNWRHIIGTAGTCRY